MTDWTHTELQAALTAYLEMAKAQDAGEPYSKAAYRRALRQGALKARSDASIEYRMRNISALMREHDRTVLSGYLPAENLGSRTWTKLLSMVENSAPPDDKHSFHNKPVNQPGMIYFNIGWMKLYRGMADDDPTLGAHGFLADHRHGAESFNFLATPAGRMEGYRPGESKRLNIARLGAKPGDDRVEGVLVIWLAREPVSARTMIVGWYANATVYASARAGSHVAAGGVWDYSVETRASDAHLVPAGARTYWVPKRQDISGCWVWAEYLLVRERERRPAGMGLCALGSGEHRCAAVHSRNQEAADQLRSRLAEENRESRC